MFYLSWGVNFFSWLLIVVAVLLILTNLGVISAAVWAWWPILLIVVAVYLLTLHKKRKKIAIHHIFQRLATDDRVQDKIKKIIETVDEVVEKKIDEWHKDVTSKKETNPENEDISGKSKVQL